LSFRELRHRTSVKFIWRLIECSGACDVDFGEGLSPTTGGTIDLR